MLNRDVAEAVRRGLTDAWEHFIKYGEAEQRMQVTSEFLLARRSYLRLKFARFRDCLLQEDPADLSYPEGPERFPIVFSSKHHSLDDYANESANVAYGPFVDAVRTNKDKSFLDLGCGLRNEVFENCLYLEVYPSLTADVVVSPDCSYPLASETFDGIGCFAVLEHVTKPWIVASEIYRMLKPGGRCYISWPFLQPIHGFPEHFYNATRQGLELMFSQNFDIESSRTEPWEGPNNTISWILGNFINSLPKKKREKLLKMTLADFLHHAPTDDFWAEILDGLPDDVLSQFACGNSLIARKRFTETVA